MSFQSKGPVRRRYDSRAAVFIDYENLSLSFTDRLVKGKNVDNLILEVIVALRRHLQQESNTQATVTKAYADFSNLHDDGLPVQRSLCLQDVEPRYVASIMQDNAVELQLCIDAVNLLSSRPDIDTFVVLTGKRLYLPLIQHIKKSGRHAIVVALESALSREIESHFSDSLFLNVSALTDDEATPAMTVPAEEDTESSPAEGTGVSEDVPAQTTAFFPVTTTIALQTLEIIEEYFGQYDEVYLTPLLRKLSDLLDESQYEPKSLISELEDCGAVRLEKRRGFPYDYTVLILENTHPDVQRIQENTFDGISGNGQFGEPDIMSKPADESEGESYYYNDFDDPLDDQLWNDTISRSEHNPGVDEPDDDIGSDEDIE